MRVEELVKAGKRGGKAPKHRWTDGERDIVRRDYNGTNASAQRIAARVGVTLYGVKGQVQIMGLANDKSPRWTEQEIEKLSELCHRYSIRTVAQKLHRSQNAVKIKATRLKMGLRYRNDWYTKKEVCEIFGVDHHWMQKRIDEDKLAATWHNGSKPQKNGGACWHIERGEVEKFLRRYPEELRGRNVDLIQVVDLLGGLA